MRSRAVDLEGDAGAALAEFLASGEDSPTPAQRQRVADLIRAEACPPGLDDLSRHRLVHWVVNRIFELAIARTAGTPGEIEALLRDTPATLVAMPRGDDGRDLLVFDDGSLRRAAPGTIADLPEMLAANAENRLFVVACIARMREPRRALFQRIYLEGQPVGVAYAALSAAHGRDPAAVALWHRSGLQELRRIMFARSGEPRRRGDMGSPALRLADDGAPGSEER